jgi:hypothetical protein
MRVENIGHLHEMIQKSYLHSEEWDLIVVLNFLKVFYGVLPDDCLI